MEKAVNRIDWNGPIQVAIVAGIILGANLPFYILHRSDIKAIEAEGKSFREQWTAETKDFHARLCVIEETRGK